MTSETENIISLTKTSEFIQLQKISQDLTFQKAQFDLLTVFEDLIDENAWSRLFAYLFDSNKAHGFRQKAFFEWINIKNEFDDTLQSFRNQLPKQEECEIITITEWYTEKNRRLDILIKIIDKNSSVKAVVGIENKVNSGEQAEQISDYQKSLMLAFKGTPSIIFFLTPDGRKPITSLNSKDCPCLSHSYQSIINVCEKLDSQSSSLSHVFVKALHQHLSKLLNINSMENQIREIIYKLYKDPKNQQAIKLIQKYSPNIQYVFNKILDSLKENPNLLSPIKSYNWEASGISVNSSECLLSIDFQDYFGICKNIYPYYFLDSEKISPDIGDKITR